MVTANRHSRKEVCQGGGAKFELKCNENLNRTNSRGWKDTKFDLRKTCQEPAMSLRRDGQVMMLSSEPGRVGPKIRNQETG